MKNIEIENPKPNFWLKLEIIGLCIGLIGAMVFATGILFWTSLSVDLQKFFYGGQPGAMTVALLILIGVISSLLFLINFFFKRLSRWWLRFFGFIIFYLAVAVIGASAIT